MDGLKSVKVKDFGPALFDPHMMSGVRLLDLFAGLAMQSLIVKHAHTHKPGEISQMAYAQGVAMLAEREYAHEMIYGKQKEVPDGH